VFDGVDDYVSVAKQTALVNAGQFTLMSWMKRRTSSSKIICYQGADAQNDVSFELWNDGFAYFEVGNSQNSYATIGNTSTNWQYLAMVFDGTQTGNSNRLKCYIDGSLLNVAYNGTIPSTSGPSNSVFSIGNSQGIGGNFSDGNISQVLIYNRAITVAEIAQNYCATVPIVTNGLVLNIDAGTQLSYVSGSTAWVDTAGNTVGTLTNGPTYNSSNLGSIVFDGVDDVIIWNSNPLSSLTSAKTYDVWIKFNNSNINTFTLCCGTLQVYIENGGTWYVNQSGAVNSYLTWTYSSGWTNFIYSFDGTNHLCYINGVAKTINFGSGVGSQTNLYIGNRINMDSPMKGNIATTRVYNRGLSATEILQNYNATKGRFGL
jgi:hypothetical protein